MTGGRNYLDPGISQTDHISVLHDDIRLKGLVIFVAQFLRPRQIHCAVGVSLIASADKRLCAGECLNSLRSTQMIIVTVGVDNITHILDVKPQLIDGVDH